jgi:hypothetical protein
MAEKRRELGFPLLSKEQPCPFADQLSSEILDAVQFIR